MKAITRPFDVLAIVATAGICVGAFVASPVTRPPAAINVASEPAAIPAESDEVHTRANAVYESFNGTAYERDASGVVQAWTLNKDMDQCMSNVGFDEWSWSATRNTAPRTNALGPSDVFAAPMSNAYSNAMIDISSSIRAEYVLRTEEISPAESTAVGECLERVPMVSDETAESASIPRVVQDLRDEWWSMLHSLDLKYGSPTAYAACMSTLGNDGDVSGGAGYSWEEELAYALPEASLIPSPGMSREMFPREWDEFVALETQYERMDWQCRADIYTSNLDVLGQAIEDFRVTHASRIAEAGDAWTGVVGRAEDLGFRGQQGLIDGRD